MMISLSHTSSVMGEVLLPRRHFMRSSNRGNQKPHAAATVVGKRMTSLPLCARATTIHHSRRPLTRRVVVGAAEAISSEEATTGGGGGGGTEAADTSSSPPSCAINGAAAAGAAEGGAEQFRFEGTRRLYGIERFDKLANAHVVVLGMGGVGSWAVEALARSGVGALTLVDLDFVCVTNVNRQVLATDATVGQSKAEVMAQRVLDINPGCHVRIVDDFVTGENVERVLGLARAPAC